MPNTYSQVHIQIVFAVMYRNAVLSPVWSAELYKYISGIIKSCGHKVLAINGMPDHIHIFIGLRPSQSISDLVREIKSGSSKWINEMGFCKTKFAWQNGFGCFSYSKSHCEGVVRYIMRQEEHHQKTSFSEEYVALLNEHEVDYDEQYLFAPTK